MFVELRELLCSGAIRRYRSSDVLRHYKTKNSKSRSCLHDKTFELGTRNITI